MNESTIDLNMVKQEYTKFPDCFESVLMGTVNREGIPDISYATYVTYEGDYYIYVSELSRHTENLMQTGKASLLFIENEESAKHLFARQRMTLDCKVTEVTRDNRHFDFIFKKFQQRFGKFMEMLKNLQDFHLFRIEPQKGSYVRGFAQAFRLEGQGLQNISHINDVGHRASNKRTADQMNRQVSES